MSGQASKSALPAKSEAEDCQAEKSGVNNYSAERVTSPFSFPSQWALTGTLGALK